MSFSSANYISIETARNGWVLEMREEVENGKGEKEIEYVKIIFSDGREMLQHLAKNLSIKLDN